MTTIDGNTDSRSALLFAALNHHFFRVSSPPRRVFDVSFRGPIPDHGPYSSAADVVGTNESAGGAAGGLADGVIGSAAGAAGGTISGLVGGVAVG